MSTAKEFEICAYVKSRKDKKLAVKIATEMFLLPRDEIENILIRGGVMSPDQQPIQTTSNEVKEMPRIKPGTFVWTAARVRTLSDMYQAGAEISVIAEKLGCSESKVYEAISRFDIVRVTIVAPNPSVSPQEMPKPSDTFQTADAVNAPQEAQGASLTPTHEPVVSCHTVNWANEALEALDLFITQYEDGKKERAFVSLGKLHRLLSDINMSKRDAA